MRSKTMLLFVSILELCFVMSGCGFLRNSHKVYMGFDKADYTIVAEEDTHGGFNGDGISYSFELAEEAHWPIIEHGYYKFNDKQSDDPADDSELFNRHSFNFEIAAYGANMKVRFVP